MCASLHRQPQAIHLLLQRGAGANLQDGGGSTALHLAAGPAELGVLLKGVQTDEDVKASASKTRAKDNTTGRRKKATSRLSIADPDQTNNMGETVLHKAAKEGAAEKLKALLAHGGCTLSARDNTGEQ
jgi:ankyrin repeat protein